MPTGHPPLLALVAMVLSWLLKPPQPQLPLQHLLHVQHQHQHQHQPLRPHLPLAQQLLPLLLCHPQQPPRSLSLLTLSLTSTSLS